MSVDEHVRRYRNRYLAGLAATAGLAAVLAATRKPPSRALSIVGAASGATVVYAAVAWPSTKRVAQEATGLFLADKVTGLFN